ncbi:hypothetical protein AAVH_21980 [Aphelenchoides avenae]|nr:hypothetical protein AAVH_21980 [Aphelenchus avenae]
MTTASESPVSDPLTISASESPTSDPLMISMIDQIEDHRAKAIQLLNDTDAYDMATTISEKVADLLKFFDDLGPFFRNGTVATFMCMGNNLFEYSCEKENA